MIRVIAGVLGYRDENGLIKPKTADSAPFLLDPETEKRLVASGVAAYVEQAVSESTGKEAAPRPSKTRSKATSKKSS
jgi:hypothetical protein